MSKNHKHTAGFTLIEIIAMLVILGAVSAMIVPFFHSGVTTSNEPMVNLAWASDFNAVMANIVAEYESAHSTDAELAVLQANIGAEGSAQTNDYGTYNVLVNDLVADVDGVAMGAGMALKVTIQNPHHPGEILSNLFTVY